MIRKTQVSHDLYDFLSYNSVGYLFVNLEAHYESFPI